MSKKIIVTNGITKEKNVLKVGQVWTPYDSGDYTLEIMEITNEFVKVKQLETGEVYEHEIDGSDGFADYLEQVLYTLKP